MEDLDYFLDKYDALPLDTDKYKNSYVGWALEFFLDETEILNPCLDITRNYAIVTILGWSRTLIALLLP